MSQQFPAPGRPQQNFPESEGIQEPHELQAGPAAPADHGYQVLPSDFQDRTPWVTYTILVVTVFVFLLQQIGTDSILGFDLSQAWVKNNERIAAGEYWRLFTPMLLHGSLIHIGFNMYALNIIGPGLERQYGHGRFFALYILSGFAGNVFSMAFTIENSLGASTAIFGLFGAQGVFFYQNRELFGARAQAAIRQIVWLSIINLTLGLSPGIDNWGHIGGLIGGVVFSWYAGPVLVWEGVPPLIKLKDGRDVTRAGIAAVGVGLVFVLLAAWLILFRVT